MCLCTIGDLCTWKQYSRMYVHVVYSSNQSDHLNTSMASAAQKPPEDHDTDRFPAAFTIKLNSIIFCNGSMMLQSYVPARDKRLVHQDQILTHVHVVYSRSNQRDQSTYVQVQFESTKPILFPKSAMLYITSRSVGCAAPVSVSKY